ncbi:MAG: hypothetical protein JWP97_1290, partial [Labilithrix sp.]|nr:hypothetical protein [Labilithrix sp.]
APIASAPRAPAAPRASVDAPVSKAAGKHADPAPSASAPSAVELGY